MSSDTIELGNDHRVHIEMDSDPDNPRTAWDNAATMLCWHGRYNLGDDHNWPEPHHAVADLLGIDMEDYAEKYRKASEALEDAPVTVLPLYLYDHGGITLSTTAFSCPWDSGQVGFIYITHKKLQEELCMDYAEGWKPNDEQSEKALAILKGEVSTYDDYLTGNVWSFTLERRVGASDEWEHKDSGSGFFGDRDAAVSAAKELIDG